MTTDHAAMLTSLSRDESPARAGIDRRWFLKAAAIGLLLPAAACQTPVMVADAGGASQSAAGRLARIRSENGLGPLAADASLEKAAMHQASYMAQADRMTHTTGWGRDFASRMDADGIAAPAAENVAHGRMDLDRLFSMWMNSAPHRRNMLDRRFNRFGLASAGNGGADGQRYWALVLGA